MAFEQGILPGFFNFITLNAFDGVAGNTNWVGVAGYIIAIGWITYRVRVGGSGRRIKSKGKNNYKL